MLESESTPVWQRALVLETFRVLAADAPLLTSIFTTYDLSPSASNALAALVAATAKLLASPAVDLAAHAEFIETLFVRINRSVRQPHSRYSPPLSLHLSLSESTDRCASRPFPSITALVSLNRRVESICLRYKARALPHPTPPVRTRDQTGRIESMHIWIPPHSIIETLFVRINRSVR
jgi:hypothetical protein